MLDANKTMLDATDSKRKQTFQISGLHLSVIELNCLENIKSFTSKFFTHFFMISYN